MSENLQFSDATTLWVLHIGNNDRIALRALEENFVCIGWTKIGDLSPHDNRPKIRTAMETAFPTWKSKTISSSYGQPYRFAHEMKVGDPIVLPVRPTGEIAIGRIAGDYRWNNDPDLMMNDYNNVRSVDWLRVVPRTTFSQAALHSFGSFSSVSTSNDYLEEVQTVLQGGTLVEEPPSVPTEEADVLDNGATAQNNYETVTQETEDYLRKAWQRTGVTFEQVVRAVFEALGYTATVTQASVDHGVDVIAHPDALGLERPFIKVQVKSGMGSIGEPEVNQLKGLLNPGEQGVLVSLGKFTSGAKAVERSSLNITLIGPQRFIELFLGHYNDLAPEWRAKFPLKQVFVPFG
ncbi:MAG: restriction endonuclease [Rubrobacteraceae bacterium]